MSTTIRLTRIGKRSQAQYRIVVKTTRDRRDGKCIEELGYYNPNPNPSVVKFNHDRINYWISKGSIISPTVKKLLEKENKQ